MPLANITLTSTATSLSFVSIASGYRDLRLVCSLTIPSNTNFLNIRLNNETANYSKVEMSSNGSSAFSQTRSNDNGFFLPYGTSLPNSSTISSVFIIDIMDYSATDKHKTVLWRSSYDISSDPRTAVAAGRLPITAAVNSVGIGTDQGPAPFGIGSTFALYGVSA